MTSKHTPGPWTIRGEDESEPLDGLPPAFDDIPDSSELHGWPFFILGPDRGLGCGFPRVHVAASIYVDADARLIAAAPDLLEALEGLYETGAPEGLALTADDMQKRFDAALKAIKKAKGF